jgi:nicotinate-nucleotide pyrophosphorylase (carboxylating)
MTFSSELLLLEINRIIAAALQEDIGDGDVTTGCIVQSETLQTGRLVAKQSGVIAGLKVARLTFSAVNKQIDFRPHVADGEAVSTGSVIASFEGPSQALLMGERVALNFLQRMSGIASTTRQFVDAVRGTKAVILDTRKTVPGLRVFDKWAVRLGGGQNHRFGLFDMVLIKENHIAAAGGSITEAVMRVRACDANQHAIEVEVKNLDELQEALGLNVDRILLDNMTLAQMTEAVSITGGRAPLEASGNVSLHNVAEVAATGVDFISVGALTHSVQALDVSMLLD